MSGLTGNTELDLQQEKHLSAVKDETSLSEVFQNSLEISQDVEPSAASKETDGRERPEQEGRQTDTQQWAVGARCQAVWSEDGRAYSATVVSVDGERCRVRFCGYNNEEDVELSALRRPTAALQRQTSQDWKPGSPCRAVYAEDGLVYPAVILWVKGQRCRIRFDDYNNEEEQDVSALLDPNQLHGPSRAAVAKGSSWRSSRNCEWRGREESQGERGGERSSVWRDEPPCSSWEKEKAGNQSKMETEEKKKGAEKLANHSPPLFPPFPPPPPFGLGDPVPFIPPPPPPLWTFDEKESGSVNVASNMLMLWYMCGFHTGSYMAQQAFRGSSKQ